LQQGDSFIFSNSHFIVESLLPVTLATLLEVVEHVVPAQVDL
jgi:hypothetical protein